MVPIRNVFACGEPRPPPSPTSNLHYCRGSRPGRHLSRKQAGKKNPALDCSRDREDRSRERRTGREPPVACCPVVAKPEWAGGLACTGQDARYRPEPVIWPGSEGRELVSSRQRAHSPIPVACIRSVYLTITLVRGCGPIQAAHHGLRSGLGWVAWWAGRFVCCQLRAKGMNSLPVCRRIEALM